MATTRTVTLEELGVVMEELTSRAPEAIYAAAKLHAIDLLRQVTMNHMTGQDLGIVTGTARRSMVQRVIPTNDSIMIEVGSPLAYVRAHEEGFSGEVQVRAHVRRLMGRSTELTRSGRRSRKRVTVGFANVRAHSRNVNIRAKHFVRKSIEELQGRLPDRVGRALLFLASKGRVPTVAELAGGAGA